MNLRHGCSPADHEVHRGGLAPPESDANAIGEDPERELRLGVGDGDLEGEDLPPELDADPNRPPGRRAAAGFASLPQRATARPASGRRMARGS